MIPIYRNWIQALRHFEAHSGETCVVVRRRLFFWTIKAEVHNLTQAAEFYGRH